MYEGNEQTQEQIALIEVTTKQSDGSELRLLKVNGKDVHKRNSGSSIEFFPSIESNHNFIALLPGKYTFTATCG
jgi:hypothetical protein